MQSSNIRMHCGLVELQNTPLGVTLHVCVRLPTISKPVLQVYVTTLPSSVSVKFLSPLSGIPGSPQSTINQSKTIYNSFCCWNISHIFLDTEMMKENKLMYRSLFYSDYHETKLFQSQNWHCHSKQIINNGTHVNLSLH